MSSIDTRSPFFPNSKTANAKSERAAQLAKSKGMQRNSSIRKNELNSKTSADAKVQIPSGVKDYSRIKKAVDAAPIIDNSEKIAHLKSQISAGTYEPDYDAMADRILEQEF